MFLLIKAVGIGLLLAVPVGPLGLLCLRRSLTLGAAAGLVTGLGVATADAIYAAAAAFALGALSGFIEDAWWLGVAGGLVLIGLGLKDLLHRGAPPPPARLSAQIGAWAGAVLLTLANPATILTFAAVIVGLGLVPDLGSPLDGLVFVAGVFAGSALWWLILCTAAGKLGDRLTPASLSRLTRAAGVGFIVFGVFAVARQI